MTDRVLIRDLRPELHRWIEQERRDQLLTQKEFMLALLEREYASRQQLPLFQTGLPRVERIPAAVPFTFIDLFAGIGGMRIGLERAGGTCVFSSEWDTYCQRTYKEWFHETPHGDLHSIAPSEIPHHEVLAAGFPCQPFSIAGVSKKNSLGRAHGFKDATQGTLVFSLASIIEEKRPPVLLLENVKNLISHDRGRTWEVICSTLEDLKYTVFWKVIDAAGWVPQHRERVFIVCFDRAVFGEHPSFRFPIPPPNPPKLREILDSAPAKKYTLTDHLWKYLQQYAERHREKGNGFGFGIADPLGVTRTLSARYVKDGSEILINQGKRKNPRRLTPRECARLMGFPEDHKIVVSDTQAYRQFGNAVVPPVVEALAHEITRVLATQVIKNGSLLKRVAI